MIFSHAFSLRYVMICTRMTITSVSILVQSVISVRQDDVNDFFPSIAFAALSCAKEWVFFLTEHALFLSLVSTYFLTFAQQNTFFFDTCSPTIQHTGRHQGNNKKKAHIHKHTYRSPPSNKFPYFTFFLTKKHVQHSHTHTHTHTHIHTLTGIATNTL
jgi:hypothetical protein